MKIIKNEKLIERNGKIAKYISLGGIAVFLIYVYYTAQFLRNPELESNQSPFLSIALLVLAFILVQITNYLGPRFGRSPRTDEKIDAGLKGLHSDFHLFHYTTPVSHLLIGPSGVWVILPYHHSGKVEFSNSRWRLSGGSFSQKYMRAFGLERLGRPDADANSEINSIKKFLSKKDGNLNVEDIKAVIVFTSDQIELVPNDSPIPAMKLKQLKEFIRQKAKERSVSQEQLKKLVSLFLDDE
jgi:hypothetical protein